MSAGDVGTSPLSEQDVVRILRWAMVELGSAGLTDRLGQEHAVPDPPPQWLNGDVAVAGRVLLLARRPPETEVGPYASFALLAEHVFPAAVVLVQADPTRGSAFGSNLALQAAVSGAQALLTDGIWRDSSRLHLVGLPIGGFGRGAASTAGRPYTRLDALELFGVCWRDDDWLLRDADAALRLDGGAAAAAAASLAADFEGELTALIGG